MRQIRAEIMIDAPAEKVWSIVVDFESYSRWNSFTPRITLRNIELARGAEFDLDCRMTEDLLLENEHEAILEVDARSFRLCMGTSRTRGRPGIRSFRWQICEVLADERTRFVNYEEFHGPLAPLVHLLYAKKLRSAFQSYCVTLKEYAESR
jgi:hypothetical protein